MNLLLVGTSYRDISLQDLEVLESKAEEIRGAICSQEATLNGIEGCVIVSTCNRFEVYVDTEREEDSARYILAQISAVTGVESLGIKVRRSVEAVSHLFRVSAGLESMIVGEVEISGQIKRALSESRRLGQTSRITEALFQRAAEVSKKVASETGLGTAGRSLIIGGLDIVKSRGFDLRNRTILVIGTGAYARVVISALEREDVGEILTYSNSGRAEVFSESHGTTPVAPEGLSEVLKSCHVIVACSGTHGVIVTSEQIREIEREVLPIIDLSLSRDVEKSVESLANVMVIDLQEIHRCAPAEHHETIALAEDLVNASVTKFGQDLEARRSDPQIRLLREHVERIVNEEVDRVRRKNGEEIAAQVSRSLQAVTKTIFHKPTIAARDSALNDESDEYHQAIQLLFGLKFDPVDE